MSIWGLISLTIVDVFVTLALSRYVFKELVAGWQFWGAFLYASVVGGFYYELMSGEGFVSFVVDALSPIEFVSLVIFSLLMAFFHFWALKIL
ncbi:hypothetical protein [Pseudomonas sp. UFMG81]|uniref:hypothetical protein n=1 Tax=Pseudomonas sp. UFMG81 TaxID=2745936 RepID=UPI00188E62BC|nr:hypothetical protein [Pseudomonas sp. UFMG81]